MNFRKILNTCINTVFPPRCPYCNAVIRFNQLACNKCAIELQQENIITTLKHCKSISPYRYDGMYKNAVWHLKFNNCPNYAEQMAIPMCIAIKSEFAEYLNDNLKFDYITCVPFTRRKYKERGYNQSQLLAKYIAMNLNLKYAPVLIKIKDNKTQHNLPRNKRQKNVSGVFDINQKYSVKGKRILIIDDILTTGSTLSECTDVLYSNGAEHILCATYVTVVVRNTDDLEQI